MHLLVTMTYDLSDVYASDWSARRYDLTGDCDSPDTLTDCHGLHRPDYTLDQVNGCYEPSISHPRNKGPCTTNLCCVLCDTACNIYIYIHWRRKRGGKGGMCPPTFLTGGAMVCLCPPPLLTPHFYFPLELYVYITLTNNNLAFLIYQLIILWTITIK